MGRVICVVQARLNSERLPRKVLADLGGKPLLAHLLDRLPKVKGLDDVVLAVGPHDDELMLCRPREEDGWPSMKGLHYPNEWNVLGRFCAAAKQWPADAVMRITADCPLLDMNEVAHMAAKYRKVSADYMAFASEVRGLQSVEVFSVAALQRMDREMASSHPDREHCGVNYVQRAPWAVCASIQPAVTWTEPVPYRLCVDESADLEVVRAVYAALGKRAYKADWVVEWLDHHPEVAAINQEVKQAS